MGFWDAMGEVAKNVAQNAMDKAKEGQEYYDKYYEWASRQSDERIKEYYNRRRKNGCSILRERMELKAYVDVLKERGY